MPGTSARDNLKNANTDLLTTDGVRAVETGTSTVGKAVVEQTIFTTS